MSEPLSVIPPDPQIDTLLGDEADVAAIGRFEIALARAQAAAGDIPAAAAEAIATIVPTLVPDRAALAHGLERDGVVVPAWLDQARAALPDHARSYLHRGATSQDAIDTSLVLRLSKLADILSDRLDAVGTALDQLAGAQGSNRLMGRTRMQDALPIRAADRIADWRAPLLRHRERLDQLAPRVFVPALGGPVGDGQSFANAAALREAMAYHLGLYPAGKAWHAQRDGVFEFAAWLAGVTGSLGKFGQDIALMALSGGSQVTLTGGGASSAMAHKRNPVNAELLVTLARRNAGLVGTMAQSLVHESERSGAAWTLEWLTLPDMVRTAGAALRLATRLVSEIERIGCEV